MSYGLELFEPEDVLIEEFRGDDRLDELARREWVREEGFMARTFLFKLQEDADDTDFLLPSRVMDDTLADEIVAEALLCARGESLRRSLPRLAASLHRPFPLASNTPEVPDRRG